MELQIFPNNYNQYFLIHTIKMLGGMFSKTAINPEEVQKIFDSLHAMIKEKRLKKVFSPIVKPEMKPLIAKFDMIISGLEEWEKDKVQEKNFELHKLSVQYQNQTKLREDSFIKLLSQCRTNISMSKIQVKQRIRNSLFSIQNIEIISNLMFEMIAKNKTLYLIQQKLKETNYLTIDATASVLKLIEDVKQNKLITETYEKIISQFTNFPNQIQISFNSITLKDKKKQTQIQSKITKMSELFKAFSRIMQQFSNLNIKIVKNNGLISPNHTKIKINIVNDWEQLLVKPVQSIIKQNQQLKQSKLQFDLVNKIINDLTSYRFDRFQQSIYNWDKATQQSLRKIKREMQSSATTVKNIYKRMAAILTNSNFMNEAQLQSQVYQKSWNTNLLLATNEKRFSDIQMLFSIYDQLVTQVRQMEVVKKRLNKNKKYTLKEEINLCILAIKQLQGKHKKQVDTSLMNQKQVDITSSSQPRLQKINSKSINQQQIQLLIVNWMQLCRTIFEPDQQTNDRNWLQQYQFYMNTFPQIVAECKRTKINLNDQLQNNILLNQQLEQLQTKIQTNKQLQYTSQNIMSVNIVSAEKIKKLQNKYQQILTQNIQKLKDELEEYKSGQYFDKQSWICSHKETLLTAKSLLKQIGRLNNKQFKTSNLLYKYSPHDKLSWNHFSGKSNILIIIKTATNKMNAIYSLAPLIKPNNPNPYTGEQKAFIFESNMVGNNQDYYYLLPDKRINGCFGNCVAFGKSDLRFTLGDDTLQGNFGYGGTFFECKGKKIPDLLGALYQSKVKMVNYQIYQIFMNQKQIEAQSQNIVDEQQIQTRINRQSSEERRQILSISSTTDFESTLTMLANTIADYDERLIELNRKLVKTVSEFQNYKKILKEKEQQLLNCNNNITKLEKSNQSVFRQSTQLGQTLNLLRKSCEQQKIVYKKQIQRLKEEQKNDLNKYKDQFSKQTKLQKQNKSALAKISSLQIKIDNFEKQNYILNQKVSDLQLQLTAYINNLQQYDKTKHSLQNQLQTFKNVTLPEKQKAIKAANKEIAELKGQVRQLKDQNKLLLKQIDEKEQKIVEIQNLAWETSNFFHQKQMKLKQQNESHIRKIQNLQQQIKKALKNPSTQKLVINESILSQSLKSQFSELQKTNQTIQQKAKINEIVCDYENKLSDLMGQFQNSKNQMKCLSEQLSQLLRVCIKSKEEELKQQIFQFLQEISKSTINIQGLVGNFQNFVNRSNELNSNNRLTTFLRKIQQSIADLHEQCERVQELDYTSCRSQVITKLKLLCKPQNIMPFSQISMIEHKEETSIHSFIGLLGQH